MKQIIKGELVDETEHSQKISFGKRIDGLTSGEIVDKINWNEFEDYKTVIEKEYCDLEDDLKTLYHLVLNGVNQDYFKGRKDRLAKAIIIITENILNVEFVKKDNNWKIK